MIIRIIRRRRRRRKNRRCRPSHYPMWLECGISKCRQEQTENTGKLLQERTGKMLNEQKWNMLRSRVVNQYFIKAKGDRNKE